MATGIHIRVGIVAFCGWPGEHKYLNNSSAMLRITVVVYLAVSAAYVPLIGKNFRFSIQWVLIMFGASAMLTAAGPT